MWSLSVTAVVAVTPVVTTVVTAVVTARVAASVADGLRFGRRVLTAEVNAVRVVRILTVALDMAWVTAVEA
jgi:hypothetical protein